MVFTSNYSNNINGNRVSISYDGGIECNFKGSFLPALSNRNQYNCEELNETTMDINKRVLRKITLDDVMEADEAFSKLMGEEVGPRRKFIEENATYAETIDV